MTAGQVSDYTGAAAPLDDLPPAQWMLDDRGYDADWYGDALQALVITPCIPGGKTWIMPIKYNKRATEPEPYLDHVRSSEGLARRRHMLRLMPDRLLLRCGPRRHRHLLALINES